MNMLTRGTLKICLARYCSREVNKEPDLRNTGTIRKTGQCCYFYLFFINAGELMIYNKMYYTRMFTLESCVSFL